MRSTTWPSTVTSSFAVPSFGPSTSSPVPVNVYFSVEPVPWLVESDRW